MTLNIRLLFLGLIFLLSSCQSDQLIVEQRILSFGTLIDITIATSAQKKQLAEKAINDIEQLLKQRHHQWHAWQKGDLSTLNAALSTGSSIVTNHDLLKLITLSKDYYQKTNGLFNPALGLLIQAWGFHDKAVMDAELIQKIQKQIPTMQHVSINQQQVSSNNPYVQLDFGGIAKGLAIQQIKAILSQNNFQHYLINMGGDLHASGTKYSKNWIAGLQNPFNRGALATIKLTDNSNLFTSGNYQRFYKQQNKIIHHIINPRTGKPSTAAIAVTVKHSNPITADVAATALMIAPQDEWQAISANLSLKDFLIITADKEIWVSKSLAQQLTFDTELKIHIITP